MPNASKTRTIRAVTIYSQVTIPLDPTRKSARKRNEEKSRQPDYGSSLCIRGQLPVVSGPQHPRLGASLKELIVPLPVSHQVHQPSHAQSKICV
jgi:hypothetical protein